MRFPTRTAALAATLSLLTLFSGASALEILESESLETCQADSGFTATLFQVYLTANNHSISFNVNGVSTISGNVTFEVDVTAYGYQITQQSVDPCESGITGLCPMSSDQIQITSNLVLPADLLSQVPGM